VQTKHLQANYAGSGECLMLNLKCSEGQRKGAPVKKYFDYYDEKTRWKVLTPESLLYFAATNVSGNSLYLAFSSKLPKRVKVLSIISSRYSSDLSLRSKSSSNIDSASFERAIFVCCWMSSMTARSRRLYKCTGVLLISKEVDNKQVLPELNIWGLSIGHERL